MAIDFRKIDKSADLKGLQKDIDDAPEGGGYPDVPADKYEAEIVSMEIKGTKEGNRPMFSVQAKIIKGEYKNQNIWMNRVIFGTKSDGSMIKSVIGFLNALDTGLEITFESYEKFNQLIMDVMEEVQTQGLEYVVDYDPNRFNSISIEEVYEKE